MHVDRQAVQCAGPGRTCLWRMQQRGGAAILHQLRQAQGGLLRVQRQVGGTQLEDGQLRDHQGGTARQYRRHRGAGADAGST